MRIKLFTHRKLTMLPAGILFGLLLSGMACVSNTLLVTSTPQPEVIEQVTDTPPVPAPTETHAPLSLPTRIPHAACVPNDTAATFANVIKITDGDTISVQFEDGTTKDLRYIGMDTPERGDPLSAEAADKNRDLTAGKAVSLIKDVSETDRYDRLLRYVFVGDTFVNYELVRQGYALAGTWPPDTSCDAVFKEAEDLAKQERLGIWALGSPTAEATGAAAGGVTIVELFFNGVKGENEPDEYVEIRNVGSGAINLQGWTLVDNGAHIFQFPAYVMQPGDICRIYTNEAHPETCGFNFAFSESAIWNNGGDCAILRDGNSSLVDEYCY